MADCTNKFNCDDPIDYSDNNFNVDQKIPRDDLPNIETGSCSLNSIMVVISEQLSKLLNTKINIDINKFIQCNEKHWNKQEYDRKLRKNTPIYPTWSDFDPSWIETTKEELRRVPGPRFGGNMYTEQEINDIIDRLSKLGRIYMWLIGFKKNTRNKQNFVPVKSTIFIPILCGNGIQQYTDDTFTQTVEDCGKECTIAIKTQAIYRANNSPPLTINDIYELLCTNGLKKVGQAGPVICNFIWSKGSDFDNFYNEAVLTNPEYYSEDGPYVDELIYEWKAGESFKDLVPNGTNHTMVLVSYECFPNPWNPTHYLFKFKDSYQYGNDDTGKAMGYFYIKMPFDAVMGVENPSPPIPWNIGDNFLITFRVYSFVVNILNEKVAKSIANGCCPTEEPTEEPTESVTESQTDDPFSE
jgi:hypothetical protein